MAGSKISGPSVSMGPLAGAAAGAQPYEYSGELGPSISYQMEGMPDIRYAVNKDNPQPGSILTHLSCVDFTTLDMIPAAVATLTVSGNATNGTPLGNITTGVAGASLGIPYLNQATNVVGTGICLDFGFSTLSCTAGNPVVTPPTVAGAVQTYLYQPGQWLLIENAGNAAGTIPLIAQVTAVNPGVNITISPAPLQTGTNTPRVGSTNVLNPNQYGNPPPTFHWPRIAGGLGAWADPRQSCMRALAVAGSASAAGGNVLIRGVDMYGYPQSEMITAAAGAGPTYGKKTYKWFVSATPQFSDAHAYTIVTSDVFGFQMRADEWEQLQVFYNATFISTAQTSTTSAMIVADQTSPATATTGDVRGTIQVSTQGGSGGVSAGNVSNGARRLAITNTLTLQQVLLGTPFNTAPIYGVTPFTS